MEPWQALTGTELNKDFQTELWTGTPVAINVDNYNYG